MFQEHQFVRIKVDDHPFTGPIKRMCQTFFRNPNLYAMYKGEWQQISMLTVEEKRPMRHITTESGKELFITEDQIVMMEDGSTKFVKDLDVGDSLKLEESFGFGTEDKIAATIAINQVGDWLFTIKVHNTAAPFFALDNGIICRGEL